MLYLVINVLYNLLTGRLTYLHNKGNNNLTKVFLFRSEFFFGQHKS